MRPVNTFCVMELSKIHDKSERLIPMSLTYLAKFLVTVTHITSNSLVIKKSSALYSWSLDLSIVF